MPATVANEQGTPCAGQARWATIQNRLKTLPRERPRRSAGVVRPPRDGSTTDAPAWSQAGALLSCGAVDRPAKRNGVCAQRRSAFPSRGCVAGEALRFGQPSSAFGGRAAGGIGVRFAGCGRVRIGGGILLGGGAHMDALGGVAAGGVTGNLHAYHHAYRQVAEG